MRPSAHLTVRARGRVAVGLLAAAAAWTGRAAAAPSTNFALVWEAPESCPSAETVRAAVVALVRARPLHPVRVNARVTREQDVFRVQIVTHREGSRGVRELEAPTCSALFDAVTIIIALAIDPELFQRSADAPAPGAGEPPGAEPDGSIDPGAESAAASASAGSRVVEEDRSALPELRSTAADAKSPVDEGVDPDIAASGFRDRGLQVVAALAGSVESGALPGLGFGVTARGGVRRRRFRAELVATRWLAREAFSAEPGKGARVSASAFAAWGCFRAVPGHTAPLRDLRLALPPDDQPAIEGGACVGVEVGRMTAESFGVTDPGSGSSGFASLGGALRLGATAAEWLSLDVRVEALSLLHRPNFELRDVGGVHQPDNWSLRASMGAEIYFP